MDDATEEDVHGISKDAEETEVSGLNMMSEEG